MKRVGMLKWGVMCMALLFAGILLPSVGMAQTSPQELGEKPAEIGYDDWRFLFYLPVWVPAVSGSVGVGGTSAPIEIDQIQSWENLKYLSQMPLSGHLEIKKGPFSLLMDGLFAKYELDAKGGATDRYPHIRADRYSWPGEDLSGRSAAQRGFPRRIYRYFCVFGK